MRKEIVLPPHLYDRIKASAGEHGGIGCVMLFDGPGGDGGEPLCAHGHAWGTCANYLRDLDDPNGSEGAYEHPELNQYLTVHDNDDALVGLPMGQRVSFAKWCELLNVKRGAEVPAPKELAEVAS